MLSVQHPGHHRGGRPRTGRSQLRTFVKIASKSPSRSPSPPPYPPSPIVASPNDQKQAAATKRATFDLAGSRRTSSAESLSLSLSPALPAHLTRTPAAPCSSPPSSLPAKQKRKPTRTRSSSNEFASPGFGFTPAVPLASSSTSGTSFPPSTFLARKSASSPLLSDIQSSPPPYSTHEFTASTSSGTRLGTHSGLMPSGSQQHLPPPPPSSSSTSSHPYSTYYQPHSRTHSQLPSPVNSDSESDRDGPPGHPRGIHVGARRGEDEDEGMIYTSSHTQKSSSSTAKSNAHHAFHPSSASWRAANGGASGSSQSLRSRIFALAAGSAGGGGGREREREREDKVISTAPGAVCAGETETETDEPSRHLPTARIIHSSGPLVPPNTFQQRLTPLLFEFSRLLSIVPAIFGTMYNIYHIFYPPSREGWSEGAGTRATPERVDFAVAALWAILTGYQCLALTTGLLTRWRLYYAPLSTLVRLLALQGICWPATHLTLSVLEHAKRPVVVWAVVGTTTCASRSVQIWVTSNLWWERRGGPAGVGEVDANAAAGPGEANEHPVGSASGVSAHLQNHTPRNLGVPATVTAAETEENRRGYWKRGWGGSSGGGKWGGRRWDWREVGVKCVLPAGVVYFVMAWVGEVRREWAGCC